METVSSRNSMSERAQPPFVLHGGSYEAKLFSIPVLIVDMLLPSSAEETRVNCVSRVAGII